MKTIPLTQGKSALVDDCDFEYLLQWKWQFERNGNTGYAGAWDEANADGRRPRIAMHRLIAQRSGLDVTDKEVDHRDGDGLNNQRGNLRIATVSQNQANRSRARNNTSGFKGVIWEPSRRKWRAQICVAGKRMTLTRRNDPLEAARAYNEAALKHYGEFACLNPV